MYATRTLKDKILPCYKHLFEDNDIQIEFLYGTRDSGKTKAGSQLAVHEYARTGKDFKCILIRKVKDTIKDSIYANVVGIIEEWKLDIYFDTSKSPMEIRSKIDKGIYLCRGLDEASKIKSLKDPTMAVIEEGDQITSEDFTMILTTLRHNEIKTKVIFMFNPQMPKGISKKEDWWLWKDWFSHTSEKSFTHTKIVEYYENNEKKELKINYRATHTTFQDNPFCTPERKAHYHNLKFTSPSLYLPYAMGEWGITEVKSPAIINFDSNKHVAKLERNPRHPIIFSSDFNCNPLVTLECQIYKENGRHVIRILREIGLKDARTINMIEFIKNNYSARDFSSCFWTGDSTGGNPHTSSTQSNWEQIESAFRLGRRLLIPTSNPNVLGSLEDLDYIFYSHPDILIDEGCTHTIFELQFTEKDEKGIIKKNRNDDAQKADYLDCLRYLNNTFNVLQNNCRKDPSYFGIR